MSNSSSTSRFSHITSIACFAFLVLSSRVQAVDWTAVAAATVKHVPRVEFQRGESKGVCSAVVFEIDKDGMAAALTAAHCVTHEPTEHFDLTLNEHNAYLVTFNRLLDLAIVRFRARSETPIALALVSPPIGEEVAVGGYAFGIRDISFQFGRVSQTYNRETKTIWINLDLIFGDSGGALFDAQGRLVGMNTAITSQGPAHIALAVPIEAIQDFIDDYRERFVKKEKEKP